MEKRRSSNDGMPIRTASDFGLEPARDRGALQRERAPRQQPRVLSRFGHNTRAFCRGYKELLCEKGPSPSASSGLAHNDLEEKI